MLPVSRRLAGVAATLLISLTACGGDDAAERAAEEQIEDAVDGDAEVDIDDGAVKVETTDGTVTVGMDLPDGFPEEVELVEGTVMMAVANPEEGGWFVTLEAAAPDTSFEDAKAALTGAGFTLDEEGTYGGASTAQLSNDTWQVTVSTAAAGAVSYVVAAL